MSKTKIYYGRDLIGRFACDGRRYTKWQIMMIKIKRMAIRVALVIVALDVIGWASVAGYHYAKGTILPEIAWAEKIVEIPIKEIPPVMKRIAKCESGNIHMKNGQVLINVNNNGTYDQGRYQINSIWNKKANELGLNLAMEKDNEAFAMYLYENYGTEHWYSSKSCWK